MKDLAKDASNVAYRMAVEMEFGRKQSIYTMLQTKRWCLELAGICSAIPLLEGTSRSITIMVFRRPHRPSTNSFRSSSHIMASQILSRCHHLRCRTEIWAMEASSVSPQWTQTSTCPHLQPCHTRAFHRLLQARFQGCLLISNRCSIPVIQLCSILISPA